MPVLRRDNSLPLGPTPPGEGRPSLPSPSRSTRTLGMPWLRSARLRLRTSIAFLVGVPTTPCHPLIASRGPKESRQAIGRPSQKEACP